MTRYPPAWFKGDGKTAGFYLYGPFRGVLHTTETRSVPGYNNGYSAPHLTYSPAHAAWVQHQDLGLAARALRNDPGGVQTNRASALQIEIVCYSYKPNADTYGGLWVGDLTGAHLDGLRDCMNWLTDRYQLAWGWPGRQAYNYAQANTPGFRMDPATWNQFNGWCGHQHVTENRHWDPGALDWATLMGTVPPPPPPGGETMLQRGDQGFAVENYQKCLQEWNPDALPVWGADGDYGAETETWVKEYQTAAQIPVTGRIDGVTADLLGQYRRWRNRRYVRGELRETLTTPH